MAMPFGRVFYTGQQQRLMAHQAGLVLAAGGARRLLALVRPHEIPTSRTAAYDVDPTAAIGSPIAWPVAPGDTNCEDDGSNDPHTNFHARAFGAPGGTVLPAKAWTSAFCAGFR